MYMRGLQGEPTQQDECSLHCVNIVNITELQVSKCACVRRGGVMSLF